jgi:glucose/mannose-6-phosphate isomerase
VDIDNHQRFSDIDTHHMLSTIDGLPDQLINAWMMGMKQELPEFRNFRQVIVAGMGGSAISADLLCAYIEPICQIPLQVHRDYSLPAWANGPETLAIISSHSGDTEETLSAFDQAIANRCTTVVISTGGQLSRKASQVCIPLWQYNFPIQPRAAVGYSFGFMLSILTRLNIIPNPSDELQDASVTMKTAQKHLKAEVQAIKNPAKRIAGQMVGRLPVVIGYGILAPVARRWKAQINEIAKTWSQYDLIPEVNHNTLAGIENPEKITPNIYALFLRIPTDRSRNQQRITLTQKTFMLQGLGTDFIEARGNTRLAQIWSTLHFGDYVAYYLAMFYGQDPTFIPTINDFKTRMSAPE